MRHIKHQNSNRHALLSSLAAPKLLMSCVEVTGTEISGVARAKRQGGPFFSAN